MKRGREFPQEDHKNKVFILDSEMCIFLADSQEEQYEEEDVSFISAHLNPDAVIWSENPDLLPLHPGKFMVGWNLETEDENEKSDQPLETMFLVKTKPTPNHSTDWKLKVTYSFSNWTYKTE